MIEIELVPAAVCVFWNSDMREAKFVFIRPHPICITRKRRELSKLSLERSRLPCGSDFPQTLLTCRRPVFPPDRAPLFLIAASGVI
jgi:hypothetical protein